MIETAIIEDEPATLAEILSADPGTVRTACPAPARYLAAINQCGSSDGVLVCTVAATLSGSYQAALQASRRARVPVRVADTGTAAGGQGLVGSRLLAPRRREPIWRLLPLPRPGAARTCALSARWITLTASKASGRSRVWLARLLTGWACTRSLSYAPAASESCGRHVPSTLPRRECSSASRHRAGLAALSM